MSSRPGSSGSNGPEQGPAWFPRLVPARIAESYPFLVLAIRARPTSVLSAGKLAFTNSQTLAMLANAPIYYVSPAEDGEP